MSEEVLDFSSNFKKDVKPKSYTELKSNVDKENVVNSLKTRIEYIDKDQVKKFGGKSKNQNENVDLNQHQSEEINRLKQELRLAHEKNSMIAQEQRELKNKWQLERNELESGILQLTAQQTQLVGTIRKKDAAFERLQAYLQKSQSASQRPAPVPSSTTAPVTAMATALVVVPNTSSVPVQSSANISVGQIGLVISKPLPSSSSQTQPVSIRDATIHSLTQLLKDSQAENDTLRSRLESKNGESESSGTSNGPTALQKRLMELERLLAISQSHRAALKEKSIIDSTALQATSVGVKRDLDTTSHLLQCAQNTIRAQEVLLHQALATSGTADANWSITENYEESADANSSPPVKKARVSTDGNDNDNLSDLFQLPPASPGTLQVLRECGWTDLPPLAAEEEKSL